MRRYAIILVVLLLMLAGCNTTRTVSDKSHSDTLITHYKEVVNIRDSVILRDSTIYSEIVNIHDSVVLIVDDSGNVKCREHYKDVSRESAKENYRKDERYGDSITSKADSTHSSVKDSDRQVVREEENLSWIDRLYLSVGKWISLAALVIVIGFLIWLVWKITKKYISWRRNGEN